MNTCCWKEATWDAKQIIVINEIKAVIIHSSWSLDLVYVSTSLYTIMPVPPILMAPRGPSSPTLISCSLWKKWRRAFRTKLLKYKSSVDSLTIQDSQSKSTYFLHKTDDSHVNFHWLLSNVVIILYQWKKRWNKVQLQFFLASTTSLPGTDIVLLICRVTVHIQAYCSLICKLRLIIWSN